jgi:hypothetical protein
MNIIYNSNKLYPQTNDDDFQTRIAEKKEFGDLIYDGSVPTNESNIIKKSDTICNADFVVANHQIFASNFISPHTPYKSILLYHGLGTGKTCSAITIAEQARLYNKRMGIKRPIIIVASPNVQTNFLKQLFNESDLHNADGIWRIKPSCIGSKLLREANPTFNNTMTKEQIVKSINKTIKTNYSFHGYESFGNLINDISTISNKNNKALSLQKLQNEFKDSLVIIDEIHNIRSDEVDTNKTAARQLKKLIASKVPNMKLVLLSATPMFHSHTEIVWLLNLMRENDNKPPIIHDNIFSNNILTDAGAIELRKLSSGYVSYVRGENPFSFPYRIWPSMFNMNIKYSKPSRSVSGKIISEQDNIKFLDLYPIPISDAQLKGYNLLLNSMDTSIDLGTEDIRNINLNYTTIEPLIQALTIVYPTVDSISTFTGKQGLDSILVEKTLQLPKLPYTRTYTYKNEIVEKYGKIFDKEHIHKYSPKISKICEHIEDSDGIVMIYSQHIKGGVVPMALALESRGFELYRSTGSTRLLNDTNDTVQASTGLKYILITGDLILSPNNSADIKKLTQHENKDGGIIKVVIISRAGSEGLDFKNIRQIHIIEPWYNMNRIEQIIGRGQRMCSHNNLPFKHRNVMIFLYFTTLLNESIESVDHYMYRMAEQKAINIGKISRILKEVAVDRIINSQQTNFTQEILNTTVIQQLSSKQTIKYTIGDAPYTVGCDYMESCLKKPNFKLNKNNYLTTYRKEHATSRTDEIQYIITSLFKTKFFYKTKDIFHFIQKTHNYSDTEIFFTLARMVEQRQDVVSKYNQIGYIIKAHNMYLFNNEQFKNSVTADDRVRVYKSNINSIVVSTVKESIHTKEESLTILNIIKNKQNIINFANLNSEQTVAWKYICDNMRNNEFHNFSSFILYSFIIDSLNYNNILQLLQETWNYPNSNTEVDAIKNIFLKYSFEITIPARIIHSSRDTNDLKHLCIFINSSSTQKQFAAIFRDGFWHIPTRHDSIIINKHTSLRQTEFKQKFNSTTHLIAGTDDGILHLYNIRSNDKSDVEISKGLTYANRKTIAFKNIIKYIGKKKSLQLPINLKLYLTNNQIIHPNFFDNLENVLNTDTNKLLIKIYKRKSFLAILVDLLLRIHQYNSTDLHILSALQPMNIKQLVTK